MTVSRVFEICNAYESGYGHGVNLDGKNGDYFTDPDLNEAYKIGYDKGSEMAHEDEYAAIKAVDEYLENHPESVVDPDPEFEKEVSKLVDGVIMEQEKTSDNTRKIHDCLKDDQHMIEKIADATEDHLEWAYQFNDGKVESKQLANTIWQVLSCNCNFRVDEKGNES